MTWASSTSGVSPARCAAIAAARPQGPPPTIRRSQSDDLVTSGPDADVRDRCVHQLAHAIQVLPRFGGQILDAARVRGGALPAGHPLVLRLGALQRREIGREFVVQNAVDLVAGAERDLVE